MPYVVSLTLLGGDYPCHLYPGSGWVASRVFFCIAFLLISYDFLFIAVLVVTFYCDWLWCVFLWQFYFPNCVIIIVLVIILTFLMLLVTILTVLMFIIMFLIRCLFYWCKNGGVIVTVIRHSCGMCNTDVSSSGSSDGIGFKCFGLHGGYRSWGVFF